MHTKPSNTRNPRLAHHKAWLQKHPSRSAEWLRSRLAEGFHIHHMDGDHSNNAPDNLLLIEGGDHLQLHRKIIPVLRDGDAFDRNAYQREYMRKRREALKASLTLP